MISSLRTCLALLTIGFVGTNLSLAGGGECADLDLRVKTIIREIGVAEINQGPFEQFEGKQARLLKELQTLGIEAVPFIVKYMDDRRLLQFEYLALENRAVNRFEAMRQYSPRLVVDAIAAVLNQVTGENFGFIYNGGEDIARSEVVRGWKDYVRNRFYEEHQNACRTEQ